MTDPTGRTFISYRRKPMREQEVSLIVQALHDYGVPTWRDITELQAEPTPEELRRVIRHPQTAAALLWLTPEVETSATIRNVELPEILERKRQGDSFFIQPMAAGGLDYPQVSSVVGENVGLDDLERWNITKAQGDPIEEAEAARIARLVLSRRLREIHQSLELGNSLKLNLHTREKAPFVTGTAFSFDWAVRFDGRMVQEGAWENHLLPALQTASATVREIAGNRHVEAAGLCTLPAAMALGSAFLAPMGTEISWRQRHPMRADQLWSLKIPVEAAAIEICSFERDVSSEDLAVIVTVSHDVEAAIVKSRDALPNFRGVVQVTGPGRGEMDLRTPGQAVDAVQRTIAAVIRATRQWRGIRRVHFFLATPIGYAVMLGQLINGLGPIFTYEHDPVDAVGVYRRAAILHPGV